MNTLEATHSVKIFKRLLQQIDPRCPDHAPLHNVLPNNGPTVGDFRELMADIAEANDQPKDD